MARFTLKPRLLHPHIVALHNLFDEDGLPMEAAEVKPGSLAEKGQEQTPLEWLDGLTQALEHANDNSSLLLTRFTQIMTTNRAVCG